MGYWRDLGLLRKDDQQAFEQATLLVRGTDEIKRINFKYKTISDDRNIDTNSIMPMSFDKRTKGIFCPSYWLPFCNGARVDFGDITMTISSTTNVIDSERALSDGKGIVGINIYFGE